MTFIDLEHAQRESVRFLKETNEVPTSRSDVNDGRNTGSPTGREAYGDGATIVVRAWESHVHGEGWQVLAIRKRKGTRDANCRNDFTCHS